MWLNFVDATFFTELYLPSVAVYVVVPADVHVAVVVLVTVHGVVVSSPHLEHVCAAVHSAPFHVNIGSPFRCGSEVTLSIADAEYVFPANLGLYEYQKLPLYPQLTPLDVMVISTESVNVLPQPSHLADTSAVMFVKSGVELNTPSNVCTCPSSPIEKNVTV